MYHRDVTRIFKAGVWGWVQILKKNISIKLKKPIQNFSLNVKVLMSTGVACPSVENFLYISKQGIKNEKHN